MKPNNTRRKLTLDKERLRYLDTPKLTDIRAGAGNNSNAACTQTCYHCDVGT